MRLSQLAVVTMAGLFSSTVFVTQAQAECKSSLPYDQLVDCIVVEGSGAKYSTKTHTATQENVVIETVVNDKYINRSQLKPNQPKSKQNVIAAAE